MSQPVRILMVCLGNICRSPMAEGALRARLQQAGLGARVEVDSAGTGNWHAGSPPDPRAIACAARNGVEIANARARQVRDSDFTGFDYLLCADADNLANLRARAPDAAARDRIMLLADFARQTRENVPDPYYGDAGDFDQVWAMVDDMAQAIVQRLRVGMG